MKTEELLRRSSAYGKSDVESTPLHSINPTSTNSGFSQLSGTALEQIILYCCPYSLQTWVTKNHNLKASDEILAGV